MDFEKLIDECNRVNAIVRLAKSVTSDHAQQESIGVLLASNQMSENLPSQLQEIDANEWEVHEQNTEESHSTISESEFDVQNEIRYLHYGDLSVADANGTTGLGVEFTEVENFYNFVENYVLQYNGKESIPTDYGFYEILQSPFVKTAKRVFDDSSADNEVLFNEDNPHKSSIEELCDVLVKNEQYLNAIEVLENNSISLMQADYPYIFLLVDLYLHKHRYYQACQTLFTLLKNDPDYQDIIPSHFAMEDEDDGYIEVETLKDLQKMFKIAAQLRAMKPDFRVEMALAKLYQVDRDYETSVDYLELVLNNTDFDEEDDRFPYVLRCLSDNLALSNKPCRALSVLHPINVGDIENIDVITKMGLISLHREDSRSAFTCFVDVVTILLDHGCNESTDNLLVNSWTRLRLCVELMGREDLCQAVDERDLNVLTRSNFYISFQEAIKADHHGRHEDS